MFCSFDNYLEFTNFLAKNFFTLYDIFQKNSELYHLLDKYILIVNGENFSETNIKIFNSSITEFATFKSNSDTLISKIRELHSKK